MSAPLRPLGGEPAPAGGRWVVVAVSAAAVGVGAGPGFLIGYVGPMLQDQLDVSRGELGLLIGLFFGSCGLGSLLTARVGASLGARWCVALDMAVVCVAMAVVARAVSYPLLVVVAVVGGAAYAFGNVGTNLAVAEVVARHRVGGMALTLKTAGVPAVAALLSVGAGLTAGHGWQPVAWALSGTAGLAGLLVWRVYPAVRVDATGPRGEARLPRGFWLLPAAAFLFIAGSQPLQSWMVTYLHEAAALPVATAGLVTSGATVVGMATMPVAAFAADRVGPPRRARFVAGVAIVATAGVLLLLAGARWSTGLLITGVTLGVAANLAGAGLTHAVVMDRAPAAVARASGVTMFGYYIGAMVAPWEFGVLADGSGGYGLPWTVCSVLLALSAAAFWAADRYLPVPPAAGSEHRRRHRAARSGEPQQAGGVTRQHGHQTPHL